MIGAIIAIVVMITVIVLSVIICDVRETRRLKKEEEAEEKARRRKVGYGNAYTNEHHNPAEDISGCVCCAYGSMLCGGRK